MRLDENGNIILDIGVDTWEGEGEVTNGDFVGKFKHAELHAVNRSYHRMEKRENLAYGLLSNPFQPMKLPYVTSWVETLENYPIGKVITLDKVKFEISSVCVFLPTYAFNGEKNIQEEDEFYIEVYFRLEGSQANPEFIYNSIISRG
ncbi:hypothetical protein [Bacillus sp. es.034]|uniref:hypothetical protein n=1 Tax=Bacillus sp. es.034 TaxID=1761763 RepID=UPI000BF5F44C|nr:hypothetical protein [Bacillus sp. es.034]PFG07157.1 hypothetical protein ATG71_4028 [Bacillus sp. es.034]